MPTKNCYYRSNDSSDEEDLSCVHKKRFYYKKVCSNCSKKQECSSDSDSTSDTESSKCSKRREHYCYKKNEAKCCNQKSKKEKCSNKISNDIEYYTKKDCQNGKIVLITIN